MTRLMVNQVRDLLAISSNIIDTAETSITWLAPESVTALFVKHGVLESLCTFVQRGGSARGLVYVQDPFIESVRDLAAAGAVIRHVDRDRPDFMLIGDCRESVSSLSVAPGRLSLESPIVAFWTDDPSYAQWLLSSFEERWTSSSA